MINVSSQMGRVGASLRTVYCTTKHAIEGMTKAMAVELAPCNIRVNAIAPTFIKTPLTAPFFEDPKFRDWAISEFRWVASVGWMKSQGPLYSLLLRPPLS